MVKLSISYWMSNIKRNVIEAILVTLVLLLFSMGSSMLAYEYGKASFVKTYEGEDGVFFETSNVEYSIFQGTASGFEGVEEAVTMGSLNTAYEFENTQYGFMDNEPVTLLGYSRELIQHFRPLLSDGQWLDEHLQAPEGTIPVVITEDLSGLKVGDEISCWGLEQRFFIVGIIRDGSEIFWNGDNYNITNKDYSAFYESVYKEVYEGFYMLALDTDLENADIQLTDGFKTIVVYRDDITREEREQNIAFMNQSGHYTVLSEFAANSREHFAQLLRAYAPTMLIVLLVVFISLFTVAVINYRSSLSALAVYYAVGMSKRQFLGLIMGAQAAGSLLSILLAWAVHSALKHILGNTIYLNLGGLQLAICVIILLMDLLIHIGASTVMFFRHTPAKYLQTRGRMV